jgi:hypothetical protein
MSGGIQTHSSMTVWLRALVLVVAATVLVAAPAARSAVGHARTTRQRKRARPHARAPKPEIDEFADVPMPDLSGAAPIAKPSRPAKPSPKKPVILKAAPVDVAADADDECDEDDEECDDEEADSTVVPEPAPAAPGVVLAAARVDAVHGPLLASADPGSLPASPSVRKRVKSHPKRQHLDEDDSEDDDTSFSLAAEADTSSRYQWHGLTVVDGPTLQPSARAAYRGFELGTAVSLPFANTGSGRVADVSAEIAHVSKLGPYSLRPSLEGTLFPAQALPSTVELGFSVAAKVIGPFSLITQHHVDVLAHPGAYFGEMGFQFAPDLARNLSLETAASWGVASAGFNTAYFGVDRFALNVVEGRAQLTWAPVEPFYFGPHAEFAVLVDPELRSAETHTEQVVVGFVGGCLW